MSDDNNPFVGADDLNAEPLASDNYDDGFVPDTDEGDTFTPPPDETPETETAQAGPEPETPEPEPETPKRIQVPKDRLDAEIAKRRELEARIRELEGGRVPEAEVPGVDFSDLPDPKTMFDEVLNGDLDAAAAIYQRSLEALSKATAKAVRDELTSQINAIPGRSKVESALQAEADAIANEYDVFNEKSEAFDETLTNEVVDLRNYYIDKGHDPVDALRKATNVVVKSEGLQSRATGKSTGRATTPDIKSKVQAAKAQPPRTGGDRNASEESTPFNIAKMSDDDMDKLSETQMARLRGDYL